MLLDIVQLLALAFVVAGIWIAALATGEIGGAMVLSGLVVLGAALAVEQRTT